jgi:hypothetical protein
MPTPTDDQQTRLALERLRRLIAVVLGTLALLSLAVALAGLWPSDVVDEFALHWFGRTSLRTRIVGVFCSFGLVLIAGLLVLLFLKLLLPRRRR